MICCETSLCGSSEAHMPLPASSVERKAICPLPGTSHRLPRSRHCSRGGSTPVVLIVVSALESKSKACLISQIYDYQWTAL